MIDNDLNESGPAFPEFDERGARHWFGTGKPARHSIQDLVQGCNSHQWRWAHYLNHLPSRRIFEAEALRRRDAAFHLAFRRCGGVLPRFAGCQAAMIDCGVDSSAWYPGLTHADLALGRKQ